MTDLSSPAKIYTKSHNQSRNSSCSTKVRSFRIKAKKQSLVWTNNTVLATYSSATQQIVLLCVWRRRNCNTMYLIRHTRRFFTWKTFWTRLFQIRTLLVKSNTSLQNSDVRRKCSFKCCSVDLYYISMYMLFNWYICSQAVRYELSMGNCTKMPVYTPEMFCLPGEKVLWFTLRGSSDMLYMFIINNMLFSLKILRSDWSDLFCHTPMNRIFTSPRPLHSAWLCVTLLTTTCDVTVTN